MPDIVGLEQHEPTSLWGLAIGESLETEMNRAAASMTEEPDAGKLHVRVCAGLHLEAHEIQQPEMAALVKPSQRPGTESCVVNR